MRNMTRHFTGPRRARRLLVAGALLVTMGGCKSLLDVTNPNNVNESALDNPAAAASLTNGVLASMLRMLSATTVPYSVATDELDWIGSRDAWFDLETGGIANYLNEFTDGAFPNVGEARYLGDLAIQKLDSFNTAGLLTDRLLLARAYLYSAITYTSIADMYDDYAFSSKQTPAAPIGRANMGTLYDKAITYLDKAQPIAAAGSDNALKYNILAYRARVKHAKAVWKLITPKGQTPANPLVNDAGANADAAAAIALGTTDQKFTIFDNLEATAGINIWFEVNGRNEHRVGAAYSNLNDPLTGAKDPTATALLAQFKAFGTQSGTFTMTSTRELRLILAEAALAQGNAVEFRNQINAVRGARQQARLRGAGAGSHDPQARAHGAALADAPAAERHVPLRHQGSRSGRTTPTSSRRSASRDCSSPSRTSSGSAIPASRIRRSARSSPARRHSSLNGEWPAGSPCASRPAILYSPLHITDAGTAEMRRFRTIAAAACTLALALNVACYEFRPVTQPLAPAGQRLRVQLTPDGISELARYLGPRVAVVEGTLVERSADGTMSIAVDQVQSESGISQPWTGEGTVSIPSMYVAGMAQSTFNAGRSAFIAIAITAGVVALAVAALHSGGAGGGPGDGGGTPPP